MHKEEDKDEDKDEDKGFPALHASQAATASLHTREVNVHLTQAFGALHNTTGRDSVALGADNTRLSPFCLLYVLIPVWPIMKVILDPQKAGVMHMTWPFHCRLASPCHNSGRAASAWRILL